MWDKRWRISTWQHINQKWDLIIIGGGITGAGIFNLAARKGIKVLLLESADFSFGTSSRSSKLVHGGLRYLQNKQFDVVRESVRERERMLKEASGLVHKLGFLFADYSNIGMAHNKLAIGTAIYDLMAPKWEHKVIRQKNVPLWEPLINKNQITGAVHYFDACVDDSRLVLRTIQDGMLHHGEALNYAKVTDFVKSKNGEVIGVLVADQSGILSPEMQEIQGNVVVNASGPWSDIVREGIKGTPKLRKLRGSHLIFSHEKLPIKQALTMIHPKDHRALFAIPWEGTTIIGTTDLDQKEMNSEPRISSEEIEYLLQATRFAFPAITVDESDIISTFAGLRPVIDTGADTPSKESRAHGFWEENGLVTISGGKLTIFRIMAADVLNYISGRLPGSPHFDHQDPVFEKTPDIGKPSFLNDQDWSGLIGRHGLESAKIGNYPQSELIRIQPMSNLWAELSYSASQEAVVHLDDLLLRRVRIGLCLPNGGLKHFERIKALVQEPLGWSESKWKVELDRYMQIWRNYYYLP